MTVDSDNTRTMAAANTTPDQSVRVEIDHVTKTFVRSGGSLVKAVDDVDLTLYDDEILVLLGPSGCGKSTLLRCLAGLEYPDSGRVVIGNEPVFDSEQRISLPPNERDVNMMFQSYALWPHMTLEANVAYPLIVGGGKKSAAISRANDYLELVGLHGLGKQYAGSVSGGQAQRAALARTLISEPAVALFDEPLSNVDAKVRARLRAELRRIHREVGFTAVYVTHDQIEAMGVASRIAVMREGKIAQLGHPVDIYETPLNRYAAQFIGEANLLTAGSLSVADDRWTAQTPIGPLVLTTANFEAVGIKPAPGGSYTIMIRPEYLRVERDANVKLTTEANTWSARIESSVFSGSHTEYVCRVDEQTDLLVWEMAAPTPLTEGDIVRLSVPDWAVRIVAED